MLGCILNQNKSKSSDNVCKLIHNKCHKKGYNNDIKSCKIFSDGTLLKMSNKIL